METRRDGGEGGKAGEGTERAGAAGETTARAEERAAEPAKDERVDALVAERDALKDRLLRLAAEFDNWKKRARGEEAEAEQRGRESVLRDLFQVLDDLERALASADANADPSAIRQGLALVVRSLQHRLERQGVERIHAAGQPFDPRLHEAVAREARPDVAPGTVVNELQRGYVSSGGRLLRPASVVVSGGPDSPAHP